MSPLLLLLGAFNGLFTAFMLLGTGVTAGKGELDDETKTLALGISALTFLNTFTFFALGFGAGRG